MLASLCFTLIQAAIFNNVYLRVFRSIFSKGQQTTSIDLCDMPKALHLLDDSELEDSNHVIAVEMPSPTNEKQLLEASRNTSEESQLLTRYVLYTTKLHKLYD